MEHSPTSATGTAWERSPWHATQRAAWGGSEEGRGVTLLDSVFAVYLEHEPGSELDSAVDGDRV